MPIFRGQPNASPGRLCKAGNHKKKRLEQRRSNGPLPCARPGQQSLPSSSLASVAAACPFYPAGGPPPVIFECLSPVVPQPVSPLSLARPCLALRCCWKTLQRSFFFGRVSALYFCVPVAVRAAALFGHLQHLASFASRDTSRSELLHLRCIDRSEPSENQQKGKKKRIVGDIFEDARIYRGEEAKETGGRRNPGPERAYKNTNEAMMMA